MGCSHPNPYHLGPFSPACQEAIHRTIALREIGYEGQLDDNGYPCGPGAFRAGRAPTFHADAPAGATDSILSHDAWYMATVDGGWDGREIDGYDHWDNR